MPFHRQSGRWGLTESFVHDFRSSRGSVSCRVVYMVHHAGFTAGWCATLRSTEDFPTNWLLHSPFSSNVLEKGEWLVLCGGVCGVKTNMTRCVCCSTPPSTTGHRLLLGGPCSLFSSNVLEKSEQVGVVWWSVWGQNKHEPVCLL